MYPWELGTLLIRQNLEMTQIQCNSNHYSRFAAKAFQEPLLDVGGPDLGRCASIEFRGSVEHIDRQVQLNKSRQQF